MTCSQGFVWGITRPVDLRALIIEAKGIHLMRPPRTAKASSLGEAEISRGMVRLD